ncbi:MAG TPA: decarboxylating 6-phosphogluconate dehydrogenase [Acidimicrobiales bacterium]|jgi:6-phosphogluconate dehydrogenase|nr:decarboxylating 6-phosphogluconate dehydrogenase [Acidimicrobiales bacterium]
MTTSNPMQLGMVGLGRMGSNIVRRLVNDGHRCVVFDVNPEAVTSLEGERVTPSTSLEDFVRELETPRVIWLMLPAAITQSTLDQLMSFVDKDDVIIDGGNSYYQDDINRAKALAERGVHYVDCGTSGGVWGLERGYSLMIGGEEEVVTRLDPIFKTIAPGNDGTSPTPGRPGNDTAAQGYLRCGPNGAGHFVKMVHNGIEYGMMAAIGEGLSILKHANVGATAATADAETSPVMNPEYYQYDFKLDDVAEVWRHGSVISSWLVDLTADALTKSPDLSEYSGRVSDSGEGRWTVEAAINESVPAPVISASLWQRYESRGEGEFTAKVLSAMRAGFGGHVEKSSS